MFLLWTGQTLRALSITVIVMRISNPISISREDVRVSFCTDTLEKCMNSSVHPTQTMIWVNSRAD